MQRNRGNGDPFSDFGDPFAVFGGGFGGQRSSMLSNIFGGRDPFDDPFFQRPFGSSMFGPNMIGPNMNGPSMFGPSLFGPNMNGPSMFGPSMIGPSMFGPNMNRPSMFRPSMNPFADGPTPGFLENRMPQPNHSRGPIIEELDSDDEGEKEDNEKRDNPRKHGRSSNGPFVEDPDDVPEGRSRQIQYMNNFNRANSMQSQPRTQSYNFQSSTVTYGGVDGAYYTSSRTRRTGSDGLTFEEAKEADTTSGQASHRISRGLHDKGHTVDRKLNSDGRVDTMQMLHNLDEDELSGFDEAWNGNARKSLPGWDKGHNVISGVGTEGQSVRGARGGLALPSTEPIQHSGNTRFNINEPSGTSRPQQHSGKTKPGVVNDVATTSRGRGGRSAAPHNKDYAKKH